MTTANTFDPELEEALRSIVDPCSIATGVPISLIDMGLILEAERTGSTARVVLQLTSPICMQIGIMEAKIREKFSAIDGVEHVQVHIDHAAEWMPSMMSEQSQIELRRRRPFSIEALRTRIGTTTGTLTQESSRISS